MELALDVIFLEGSLGGSEFVFRYPDPLNETLFQF